MRMLAFRAWVVAAALKQNAVVQLRSGYSQEAEIATTGAPVSLQEHDGADGQHHRMEQQSLEEELPQHDGMLLGQQQQVGSVVEQEVVVKTDVDEEVVGCVRAFFAGAKRLWGDVGSWRELRRQTRSLNWREQRIVRSTPRHLVRMLPLLLNPLPPPFGFVLIGAASTLPRFLLTPEFWTIAQCENFSKAASLATRRRHAKLLAECALSNELVVAPVQVSSLTTTAVAASSSSLETLLASIVAAFDEDAPLSLELLSRRHLIRLARTLRPRPVSRFLLRLYPKKRLRRRLRAAAESTTREDEALAAFVADGTQQISTRELFDVCALRGIRVDGDNTARLARLKTWFWARQAIVNSLRDNRPLPLSLVLHMPALFSALLEQQQQQQPDS